MLKRSTVRIAAVILAALMMLSGCTSPVNTGDIAAVTTDVPVRTDEAPTAEPVPEPTAEPTPEPTPEPFFENISNKEPGHYEFNPHVFSSFYAKAYGETYRDDFFNFCDAVRNGEDTFRCSSYNAYGWCMGRFANYFFPIARNLVSMYTENPEDFLGYYEDGIGHIYYTIPKEEFLQKEREFEQTITDILNAAIGDDYDDFEKIVGLYEYISRNYIYDYDLADRLGEFGTDMETTVYNLLVRGQGICMQYGGLYAYLLLQCGIDAVEISNGNGYPYSHQWTYVMLNGEGYHVDTTWSLTSQEGNLTLNYLLMTDRERSEGDLEGAATYRAAGLSEESRDVLDYWASDDRYSELHTGCLYVGMDRQNKKLKYLDYDMAEKEFDYGEKEGYYDNK